MMGDEEIACDSFYQSHVALRPSELDEFGRALCPPGGVGGCSSGGSFERATDETQEVLLLDEGPVLFAEWAGLICSAYVRQRQLLNAGDVDPSSLQAHGLKVIHWDEELGHDRVVVQAGIFHSATVGESAEEDVVQCTLRRPRPRTLDDAAGQGRGVPSGSAAGAADGCGAEAGGRSESSGGGWAVAGVGSLGLAAREEQLRREAAEAGRCLVAAALRGALLATPEG